MGPLLGVLLFLFFIVPLAAAPSEKQVASDAATFHRFRIHALAKANEINRHSSDQTAGAKYIGVECTRLARQTSPDFLYGIVRDLIADDSRTEEPYFIAILVLDHYPPEAARKVVRAILKDSAYRTCSDVRNWTWEIDQAEKARKDPLHADSY